LARLPPLSTGWACMMFMGLQICQSNLMFLLQVGGRGRQLGGTPG
jgi:hypothetical protein